MPKAHASRGVRTPWVEILSDDELAELNGVLAWKSFSADARGRRFGAAFQPGKRDRPQAIPDARIDLLDRALPLASRSVVEVGCFEGHHTVGLCQRARSVVAVDARVENVVKAIVRTAFFDQRPRVLVCDVERPHPDVEPWLAADVCFHVGVLYHLRDPVRHLAWLGQRIRDGVLLDTHYATDAMATDHHEVDGERYAVHSYPEGGRDDVFSGVYERSRWLRLDDIRGVLARAGFTDVQHLETREERNGPRVLLLATRDRCG